MRQVVERRSVQINIPKFVEEYYGARKSKDFEDCEELKDYFNKVYNRMNPSIQEGTRKFIKNYLIKNKINDKKDLGGLFKDLI